MGEPFLRFFSIVQGAASDVGCTFFLDSGDDHDMVTADLDCQDLWGWLVPDSGARAFETAWLDREDMSRFSDMFVLAHWSGTPGDIKISFEASFS